MVFCFYTTIQQGDDRINAGIKHSFQTVYHDSMGLSVYNCGFQKCNPMHTWGPAMKNYYIIHIIASGHGTVTYKENTYSLQAGDGFLCLADELISYAADETDPWEYYWVGFNGLDAARLISASGLSMDNPCFHSDNAKQLIQSIMNIYESYGNQLHNEVQMCALLYGFFAQLIEENQTAFPVSHISTDYISAAVKYIEHNYSNAISISDIAENTGISRSHLYRLFMQELNITPNEYLVQYRIANACKLLRENNVNISEAAYSSGFSDPLYFSRVFKKLKGMTPSEYSKQSQTDRIVPSKITV